MSFEHFDFVLEPASVRVHIMAHISCSVCAMQTPLILLNFSWISAFYDDILEAILITDKKLLHFNSQKSGQVLHVEKAGFPRPGHNYYCSGVTKYAYLHMYL